MQEATEPTVVRLQRRLRAFAVAREWESFHTPKNLAAAATVEAGELLEIFQWLTAEESMRLDQDRIQRVREEIADIFIYLLRLADTLGIDILKAAARKIDANEARYPIERARGSAAKAPPAE